MTLKRTVHCRHCGQNRPRRWDTDGRGHLVDVTPPCPNHQSPKWRATIDHDRRLSAVCQLCDQPVSGKPKVALYCAEHRAERRRATFQRFYHSGRGKLHGLRYRQRNRQHLAEKALAKLHALTPEQRAERYQKNHAWARAHPEKRRAQRKRSLIQQWRRSQEEAAA